MRAQPPAAVPAPLYARVLRLRGIRPGGLLCFLYFEGAVALGALLALAELTSWWSVIVLPVTVAAMVKVNDVITVLGTVPARPTLTARAVAPVPRARGRAAIPLRTVEPALVGQTRPIRTNQRSFDRPAG
ncbi:MAG TPA: hypothetical protein VJT31_24620 [Rugosimonospora sp.]|nr:hypothetical protein [Rugosimonospora sp.]